MNDESNTRYCPQCGTAVTVDANYCTSCGHKLVSKNQRPIDNQSQDDSGAQETVNVDESKNHQAVSAPSPITTFALWSSMPLGKSILISTLTSIFLQIFVGTVIGWIAGFMVGFVLYDPHYTEHHQSTDQNRNE
jgi:uncharacterized membrane protein YvbJ